METPITTKNIVNKPRRVIRTAFVIALVFIAGAIMIGYSNIDGMKGGFAIIAFCIFFALTALVTAMVFISRARAFDELLIKMKPLVRWTYDQEEWDAFIKEDLKERLVVNKSTLKYVSGIALVVMLFLLLIYRDIFFLWLIAGLILLLTIVAFTAPVLQSAALKKGRHEAIIGETAAYVGGSFQTWTGLGAHLTAVDIFTEGEIPILHIVFEFPTLQGFQQEIIRIPVPVRMAKQANELVGLLQLRIDH